MPDWRKFTIRKLAICFAATFAIFVLCCYLTYAWSAEISTSPVATFVLVGVMGLMALLSPIFAIKLIGSSLKHIGVTLSGNRKSNK